MSESPKIQQLPIQTGPVQQQQPPQTSQPPQQVQPEFPAGTRMFTMTRKQGLKVNLLIRRLQFELENLALAHDLDPHAFELRSTENHSLLVAIPKKPTEPAPPPPRQLSVQEIEQLGERRLQEALAKRNQQKANDPAYQSSLFKEADSGDVEGPGDD